MKKFIIFLGLLLICKTSMEQVGVNTDGSEPNKSAILDIKSFTKGLLLPRMTLVQIKNIQGPANGLIVYNTDDDKLYIYRDLCSCWTDIQLGSSTVTPNDPCGSNIIDPRDGQTYATVQIGTQCWMAENLNIGKMINSSFNQLNNDTIEKYCYDNDSTYCNEYGALYQWNEMMDYTTAQGARGICPPGWHIPTDNEWKTMEMYLGMSQTEADKMNFRGTDEGGKLKETGTTHWVNPIGATNTTGFTALGSGMRNTNSLFTGLKQDAFFWTTADNSGDQAIYRQLVRYNAKIARNYANKYLGYSIRCIKD
jgi:uncharacterized protein (TIGR02145 family)